ncbi:MAG: flavin reductase family protein [Bacillota bacterium]|uniref:Flavin reductase family protein n=1 Tax=Virgibacillus salarius TaxID=447199 RepID=A0A941DS78_9BACI|nr:MULTISPECIES: flavin reductase family protein [Bacillaceae]NAZ08857.1 flavin reductase [Agaribacter marinus]MBR7796149.1 flavin reductase family protein [Virgibacillus salarius]MCC2251739.1 flavin reductase family protein [Virgibacillus sp. AGTR]QRZ17110.1 flavin reductase family protein [Virgibacillus sp. AGTR]WBX79352.1 flavin reductase family protein [Virgibacillus salarius]
MDERLFRDVMGQFATGITIISTNYHEEIVGMTVNAFMSVSLDPKLIAVSIDEKASMYKKLQETMQFGISILTDEQKDLSKIFARQKAKDREVPFIQQGDVPVIEGSLATMACHVKETAKAGDHLIFIAEVTEIKSNEGEPVIFYGGNYRQLY